MFKRISNLGLIAAIGAMAVGTAFANPIDVTLTAATTGSPTSTVYSNSFTSVPQLFSYSGGVGGWNIAGSISLTSSTIDISNISVACAMSSCSALTTDLSVSGLTANVGANGLEQILTGHLVHGSGTVTQWAMIGSDYVGSSNGMPTNGKPTFILTSTGGNGAYSGGSYTLQLIDQFSGGCTGSNCVEYSTDSSIVPTPEPGTLAIFGAGLLGCALFINRRRRASRQS